MWAVWEGVGSSTAKVGMGHPSCPLKHLPMDRCYQKAKGCVRRWAMRSQPGVGAGSIHAYEG